MIPSLSLLINQYKCQTVSRSVSCWQQNHSFEPFPSRKCYRSIKTLLLFYTVNPELVSCEPDSIERHFHGYSECCRYCILVIDIRRQIISRIDVCARDINACTSPTVLKLFIQPGGTLDWSKVYSFAHRQRESCTMSMSVCSSHYIHSAAPSHQLWRAFTWVDRWLSWGSTAPNRGALTCQLSVSPPKPALSCHLLRANHGDTSSLCQETVLEITI